MKNAETIAEALRDLIHEYEDRAAQFGDESLWRKYEDLATLPTAKNALKRWDEAAVPPAPSLAEMIEALYSAAHPPRMQSVHEAAPEKLISEMNEILVDAAERVPVGIVDHPVILTDGTRVFAWYGSEWHIYDDAAPQCEHYTDEDSANPVVKWMEWKTPEPSLAAKIDAFYSSPECEISTLARIVALEKLLAGANQ